MNNKPLISIFVPTRNRYVYLKNLIKLIESFNDERIELVIHDNSDSNIEILEYLNSFDLVSTKYYYYQGFLTMSDNSTKAFLHCSGEYVCMIGDDDAVCHNIAECAEWMRTFDVDALRSTILHFDYSSTSNNLLYWEDISPTYTILDPLRELKNVLSGGLIDFGNIPKPYHGIIKRDVLRKIYDIGGTCFPGCTPDMSGAVASCFFVRKYVKVNLPVIIPAASPADSGGMSGQVNELDEVPWISQEIKDNWESKIPKIWAREFIWSESGSKALRYTGNGEMLKLLDYYMTLGRYIIMRKSHRIKVFQFAPNKFKLVYAIIKILMKDVSKHIIRRLVISKLNGKLHGIYNSKRNCRDIFEAEQFFSNINNFPFSKLSIIQ